MGKRIVHEAFETHGVRHAELVDQTANLGLVRLVPFLGVSEDQHAHLGDVSTEEVGGAHEDVDALVLDQASGAHDVEPR